MFEFHMRYREIPIKRYKKIHTGPKIQLGGVNVGFWMVVYHASTELLVNSPPIRPAAWHPSMDINNLITFIFMPTPFY